MVCFITDYDSYKFTSTFVNGIFFKKTDYEFFKTLYFKKFYFYFVNL